MANFQFRHETGYRGIVKLDDTIMLATGGDINISHEPMYSSGDWGAGYMNAAENVAYSNNFLSLSGNIAIEMTAGEPFSKMKKFAFTDRGKTNGTSIIILPTGQQGFIGRGWCTSFNVDASENSNLTASMDWSSYIDDAGGNQIVTGIADASELGASGGVLGFGALFPYWASCVKNSGDKLDGVTTWSASYSSSVEFVKCCTGDSEAPKRPDYATLGSMTGECSLTVFGIEGEFHPNAYHSVREIEIEINSSDGNDNHVIIIPKMACSSGSTSIQTGGGYITCNFNYTAIGDGSRPPVSLQ